MGSSYSRSVVGASTASSFSSFLFFFPLCHFCTNICSKRGGFGHGVPPQIAKSQYDVPLPSVEVLVSSPQPTSQHIRAAHCHIALCRLTEILGELLPLVYLLQLRQTRETSKKLRHIRTDLDMWEDSLPEWLRSPLRSTESPVSGSSSLHLGFLAVKMLVCRVELHVREPQVHPRTYPNLIYLFLFLIFFSNDAEMLSRKLTIRIMTTPRLVVTFKPNAVRQPKILYGLCQLCNQLIFRSSGYLVRPREDDSYSGS